MSKRHLCIGAIWGVLALVVPASAMAGIIAVVGDVNAIGHDGNYDEIESGFFDAVLGTGSEVAFSRNFGVGLQVNIFNHFSSLAGVTATEESSVLSEAVLANYDMLVVTKFYDTVVDYSTAEISAISSWITSGGSLLAILEAPALSQTLVNYNAFLSGVGSSISFTGDRLTTIDADNFSETSSFASGELGVFDCNSCNVLSGGSVVYSSSLGPFVAVDLPAEVPEPSAFALLGLGLLSLRLTLGSVRRV